MEDMGGKRGSVNYDEVQTEAERKHSEEVYRQLMAVVKKPEVESNPRLDVIVALGRHSSCQATPPYLMVLGANLFAQGLHQMTEGMPGRVPVQFVMQGMMIVAGFAQMLGDFAAIIAKYYGEEQGSKLDPTRELEVRRLLEGLSQDSSGDAEG